LDRQRPAFGTAVALSPEQIVADRVLGEELQRAVDALDDRFRVVLLLIDVDDSPVAKWPMCSGSRSGRCCRA